MTLQPSLSKTLVDEALMTTYPPLNVLKPVGDRILIVDSGPVQAGGVIPLPVRMTVIQLNAGFLLLHSQRRATRSFEKSFNRSGQFGISSLPTALTGAS